MIFSWVNTLKREAVHESHVLQGNIGVPCCIWCVQNVNSSTFYCQSLCVKPIFKQIFQLNKYGDYDLHESGIFEYGCINSIDHGIWPTFNVFFHSINKVSFCGVFCTHSIVLSSSTQPVPFISVKQQNNWPQQLSVPMSCIFFKTEGSFISLIQRI